MPKSIAFIPHRQRLERFKEVYLQAISSCMNYPYQAEDGRNLSPIQLRLAEKCSEISSLPYWRFTDCCTDSLQIAVSALTSENDTIIVPSYGWRAFTNAVRFLNRNLLFCDIDDTGNIDTTQAQELIEKHKPAAIIVVHNFGTIVDVRKIEAVCSKYKVKIIEDAAPSFYMNEPYSYVPGTASDIVCYSFDFTKNPGTLGSGGGIATRYADVDEAVYELQSHGLSRDGKVVRVGTKSFLDNTSCGVLYADIHLHEKHKFREARRSVADWYKNNLPFEPIEGENYIWERYSLKVPEKLVDKALISLHSVNCLARTMFKEPLSSLSIYNQDLNLPKTEQFTKNLIHLPCHHYITEEDRETIKKALECL